jgi:hypothetical protein
VDGWMDGCKAVFRIPFCIIERKKERKKEI